MTTSTSLADLSQFLQLGTAGPLVHFLEAPPATDDDASVGISPRQTSPGPSSASASSLTVKVVLAERALRLHATKHDKLEMTKEHITHALAAHTGDPAELHDAMRIVTKQIACSRLKAHKLHEDIKEARARADSAQKRRDAAEASHKLAAQAPPLGRSGVNGITSAPKATNPGTA